MTTFSETSLPALIFSVPAGHPKGDVPALGRLTVNEAQAVDQWWLTWGVETNDFYTHTDSTGSGALFYEAESRTALGGSATAVGPSGASGGGSNVMRNTALTTTYQAILGTQATGGGSHLSHVGEFRVYARVQIPTTNAGTTTVALEWAVGDFRKYTLNDAVTLDPLWEGTWRLLDLGIVSVPQVLTGTQRWEGRVLAKSTAASDDIDIDYLLLIPTDLNWGVAQAVMRATNPTSFTARDEFDQAAGVLAGKTLPTTGTWSGAGSATDFSIVSGAVARRTAVSETPFDGGRFERAAAGTLTATVVQVDFRTSSTAGSPIQGVFARYTDTSNWVAARFNVSTVELVKKVAGVRSVLLTDIGSAIATDTWYTIRLLIDAAGRWAIWTARTGIEQLTLLDVGWDTDLATGGALASGGYGMYDEQNGSSAANRDYDNFIVFAPASDAAMFASQSIDIRHDGVIRKDSAGAIWTPVSSFQGDLMKVPPTGREQRSVRFVVKACRNDPVTLPDPAIDDINATLAYSARYLSVPAAS